MGRMTDLLAVLFLVAFFTVAVGLVKACERIMGPDVESQKADDDAAATDEQVAA